MTIKDFVFWVTYGADDIRGERQIQELCFFVAVLMGKLDMFLFRDTYSEPHSDSVRRAVNQLTSDGTLSVSEFQGDFWFKHTKRWRVADTIEERDIWHCANLVHSVFAKYPERSVTCASHIYWLHLNTKYRGQMPRIISIDTAQNLIEYHDYSDEHQSNGIKILIRLGLCKFSSLID